MKPCAKCGCTERYANGSCKSCMVATNAKRSAYKAEWKARNKDRLHELDVAYRAANKDRIKANHVAWRSKNKHVTQRYAKEFADKNKEVLRERANAYYATHKEQAAVSRAKWRAANLDLRSEYEQKRRAQKRASESTLSRGMRKRLFTLQQGKCPCCGQPLGTDYHLDHILPLKLGGTNTDGNVQLLRAVCNIQKGAKHPIDYMQEKGFLL